MTKEYTLEELSYAMPPGWLEMVKAKGIESEKHRAKGLRKNSGLKWFNTDERLPYDGQYVLGYYNGGNWGCDKDPKRVNLLMVQFKKGLSMEDRLKIESGEMEPPKGRELHPYGDTIGKLSIHSEDEYFNNYEAYCWDYSGHHKDGQEIQFWAQIDLSGLRFQE